MKLFAEHIQAPTTVEVVVAALIDAIELMEPGVGRELPGEKELAEQLGVSRPTLRKALHILRDVGLLSVRRGIGGGIFLESDLIPYDLITRRLSFEAEQTIDFLRARRALETTATIVATVRADEDDFRHLERANLLMRKYVDDRTCFVRADAMFHRSVARATHNATLSRAVISMMNAFAHVRGSVRGVSNEVAIGIHDRQLQAMRQRDLARVVGVLEEHFSLLEQIYLPQLSEAMPSDAAAPTAEELTLKVSLLVGSSAGAVPRS
jgi:GntR family transcriptional repressor for pyruvate dehydrogenase complex